MKLTAKARKKLPKKDFAVPSKRAYPIEDKKHAKAALMLINKGSLSPSEKVKVKAKAHKMLGKKK
jgi:hypothetical protein